MKGFGDEVPASLVDIWRQIILGDQKSWAVFPNGTCIILMDPALDPGPTKLRVQAEAIMKEWGPVHAGSSAGDFTIITLTDVPGWVVTGHHPDMLNYVAPDELDEKEPSDLLVGLLGRSKRNQDSEHPHVIHIEDKRRRKT